jgi:hypothetical protein
VGARSSSALHSLSPEVQTVTLAGLGRLHLAGDARLLDQPGIAVVGSRRASHEGRALAAAVASELVRQGIVVISGLAAGIDATAHEAAMLAGGRTIAVLGTSLDRAYRVCDARRETRRGPRPQPGSRSTPARETAPPSIRGRRRRPCRPRAALRRRARSAIRFGSEGAEAQTPGQRVSRVAEQFPQVVNLCYWLPIQDSDLLSRRSSARIGPGAQRSALQAACRPEPRQAMGSVTSNVAPSPGWLTTLTRPPRAVESL